MIRTALITLALAITFTTQAQTPQYVASSVFEAVYATEVPCSQLSSITDLLGQFPHTHCGFINDRLTSANKTLTEETMRSVGYTQATPWETTYGAVETHVSGYIGSTWVAGAMLAMTDSVDGTAMIIVFDK